MGGFSRELTHAGANIAQWFVSDASTVRLEVEGRRAPTARKRKLSRFACELRRELFEQSTQGRCRLRDRLRAKPLTELVGPNRLRFGNELELLLAVRRQLQQLGALMRGIVAIAGETVRHQKVGHALNTLTSQPQETRDFGNRARIVLGGGQHLPARTSLPSRRSQPVARRE